MVFLNSPSRRDAQKCDKKQPAKIGFGFFCRFFCKNCQRNLCRFFWVICFRHGIFSKDFCGVFELPLPRDVQKHTNKKDKKRKPGGG
jgi:hypothetical protein